eukprot:TRINITY_DN905_c0_g1_i1.p1 TRINITY_DN905_c0_g1~~TRINITY_DN905_c0_g1_i1.p1  ORF type:complete len:143 (-),score=29.28 TRINITY_DN905_c0_g1_i1:46-474(-)
MKVVIFIVASLLFLVYTAKSDWTSCGTGPFVMENATIVPSPPVRGQSFTVYYNGTINTKITGGTQTFTVWEYLFGVWVQGPYSVGIDICKTNACPFGPGKVELNMVEEIPSFVPDGTYAVGVNFNSTANELLTCFHVIFALG